MSKDRNYIIVLGGIFVIIGIIVFGIFKYIIFGITNVNTQAMDFLIFVIPSILGASLIIVSILNLVEKKDLKALTELNNEYSKTIIIQQETFINQLTKIQEGIAKINENENERNRLLLIKDSKHKKAHENIDTRFNAIEQAFSEHIENHN